MRILWLNHRDTNHPEAGGAEVHLREVCKRLVERGCDVTLLSERFRGSSPIEVVDGIRTLRIGDKFTVHLFGLLLVRKLAKNHDVVVDDIAHAVPWWSGLMTTRPVVGIIHHVHQQMLSVELDFPLSLVAKLAEKTIRFTYRKIIADSEATKKDAETLLGIRGSRIEVVYCGVDHNLYVPSEKKFEEPTLLWVGRIKRYKNVEHLLAAFSMVKREVPNLRLIIDGNGNHKEQVVQFAKKLGVNDVLFIDPVKGEEKVQLFGKSWALCLTSIVEGWGLVIVEAAACGTPTIAYDCGPSRESIVDRKTGLLVDYGDVQALADKIRLVVSNRNLRESLSRGALEHSRKFDWDKTANETFRILQEIVNN